MCRLCKWREIERQLGQKRKNKQYRYNENRVRPPKNPRVNNKYLHIILSESHNVCYV